VIRRAARVAAADRRHQLEPARPARELRAHRQERRSRDRRHLARGARGGELRRELRGEVVLGDSR
jgi:hypothetical protein